jgi:hypothetical protein
MNEISTLSRSYTSFSGADIVCIFNGDIVMEAQGISYSITREKAPIYTLGSAEPRAFSRGKRGIAGSMIFTIFDKDPLNLLRDSQRHQELRYFSKRTDRVRPEELEDPIDISMNELDDSVLAAAYYDDQLLPFDIVIFASNEYGKKSSQVIYGVEILNAGAGISVDDITNEMQMTFVAQSISPWQRLSADLKSAVSNQDPLSILNARTNLAIGDLQALPEKEIVLPDFSTKPVLVNNIPVSMNKKMWSDAAAAAGAR